jgi:hypothetical protein
MTNLHDGSAGDPRPIPDTVTVSSILDRFARKLTELNDRNMRLGGRRSRRRTRGISLLRSSRSRITWRCSRVGVRVVAARSLKRLVLRRLRFFLRVPEWMIRVLTWEARLRDPLSHHRRRPAVDLSAV